MHFFVIYSPYILLKCQLTPRVIWWHLCCTILISSDYCEVILRERNTPLLGAAISEFLPLWCCFTSQGLDTAGGGGGGLGKQEILMGRAHVPSTHKRPCTHNKNWAGTSLPMVISRRSQWGFFLRNWIFSEFSQAFRWPLFLCFMLPIKAADREVLSHFPASLLLELPRIASSSFAAMWDKISRDTEIQTVPGIFPSPL